MANIIKLGSLLREGAHIKPGSKYRSDKTISFADGNKLSWVVVNGLLIADHSLLTNISWDNLHQQDLVFGKQVTINGQQFLCRSLKVGTEKCELNEWDAALDAVGDDDETWHWKKQFFWGQESVDVLHRAFRGYFSARFWDYSLFNYQSVSAGFRPALVSLPSDNLVAGDTVCAIGSQTILYGKLVDLTRYDAIIQPEAASMMAETDAGKCYSKLPDGMVVLDRTHMAIQTIKGK